MKIRPALLRIFLRRIPLIKLRVVLSGTNRVRIPLRSNQFFTRWNDCNWRYFAFISIWLAARLNSETSLFSPFHWIKKYFYMEWRRVVETWVILEHSVVSNEWNCHINRSAITARGKIRHVEKEFRRRIYVYIDMRKTESFAEETLNK